MNKKIDFISKCKILSPINQIDQEMDRSLIVQKHSLGEFAELS